MTLIEQIVAVLGLKKPFVIGGLIGAAISLRFVKEGTSWIGKLAFVTSGWAVASYVGPLAAARMRLQGDDAYGVGFVLGLFGLSLVAAIWEAISKNDWAALARGAFERLVGKGK